MAYPLSAWGWGLLALAALLAGLVSVLLEKLIFRAVHMRAKAASSDLGSVIVEGLHPGLAVVLLCAAAWALLRYAAPLPGAEGALAVRLVFILFALSLAFTLEKTLRVVLQHRASRQARWQAAATLSHRLGAAALYTLAALVVLDFFGIPITPILASVGIAGLAVALALQDTLANFFAGIWMQTDRSLQVGHFVRVEDSKQEGYLSDIGWRTAKLRTQNGNLVIIPNSVLAKSVVTDFHLPTPRTQLQIQVSVGYECDVEAVERLLVEEGKRTAATVPGMLADPEPFVRFVPGFGEYSLDLTLTLYVRETSDRLLAEHLVRKALLTRLRAAGIRMPYPIREGYTVREGRPDVSYGPPAQEGRAESGKGLIPP
ncbi:MAG: mechanosensitive ion channel family protein [Thermoplasmatota archaeon]